MSLFPPAPVRTPTSEQTPAPKGLFPREWQTWFAQLVQKLNTFVAGTGTVTSVGLSMPTEFVVANSPVTTAGTLAVTKATETANTVYAGPTTGVATQPTFRALVAADIPSSFLQDLFQTVAVSGQSDIVADTPTDTLTIAAGANITLTTDATTDTLTIAASTGGPIDLDLTLVQHGATSSVANAATIALSVASTGIGSLLVVGAYNASSRTVTGVADSAGNTYVQGSGCQGTVGTRAIDLWYCLSAVTGGATTVTITFSGSAGTFLKEIYFWEVSGFTNCTFDAGGHVSAGTGSGTTEAGASVSTHSAVGFAAGIVETQTSPGITQNPKSGNAFTSGGDLTSGDAGCSYLFPAGTSSVQPVWTSTASNDSYISSTIAFYEGSPAKLGDILYFGANQWERLAGNTSATEKFLSQTGTGSVSAPPAWATTPDTGITQLTSDVTAGPGSGSQVATLAASGVVAATYGDATNVPQIAVDAKGRITSATNVTITGGTSASAVPIVVTSNQTVAANTGMVIPESLEIAPNVTFEIAAGALVEITGAVNVNVMALIMSLTIVSDTPAVIFNSIPATYTHLRIVAYGRTSDSSENNNIFLRFNGDSGNNYDYQRTAVAKATTGFTGNFAQTSANCGIFPGQGSATVTETGVSDVLIPAYAGTALQKCGTSVSGQVSATSATGSTETIHNGFLWRSTAAITRVDLLPASGGFKAGSVFSLYGMV